MSFNNYDFDGRGRQANKLSARTDSPATLSPNHRSSNPPQGRSITILEDSARQARSLSRAPRRSSFDSHYKWTILHKNPGDRLVKNEDDEEDEDTDVSDEEQISDNDQDDDIVDYDLGSIVLPNFSSTIAHIIEGETDVAVKSDLITESEYEFGVVQEKFAKCLVTITNGKFFELEKVGKSYLLYIDLSSESTYVLEYLFGTVLTSGDILYVIHVDPSFRPSNESTVREKTQKLANRVKYTLQQCPQLMCHVVIQCLSHPYPKHLLNEVIHGCNCEMLVTSLTLLLGNLNNYVCAVPTMVIKKKLKKAKKKDMFE